MNIVFFGTSEFAVQPLDTLIKTGHRISTVVTQPDRKKGRHLKVMPSPVKVVALSNKIPLYQPCDASSEESAAYLKGLGADLFIVISFGQILKRQMLDIPHLYSINIHASLLPKYRGAAPTNWAVINGEKVSGVTAIRMNERMDAGDIILKKEAKIDEDDTNITLSEKLSSLGADILQEAMSLIEKGKANFLKQDEAEATYAPKLKKEDGLIGWNEDALAIRNKVRGLIPWPGAYTFLDGKILKIWQADALAPSDRKGGAKPGEVVDIEKGKGIIVRAGSGDIAIKYLQLESGKIMDADSFLRGHHLALHHVLQGRS